MLVAIGLGAAVGSYLTQRVMVRRGLGNNYANGVHWAQNAQAYLNRGDIVNAFKNLLNAYVAIGAYTKASTQNLTASVYGPNPATQKAQIQMWINFILERAGDVTAKNQRP